MNDHCLFVPAALIARATSEPVEDRSVRLTLQFEAITAYAEWPFDEKDQFVDHTSDDQSALMDDGRLQAFRFSTTT